MKAKIGLFALLTTFGIASAAGQNRWRGVAPKVLATPYILNFDSEDAVATVTIEDANHDDCTWMFFGDCMIYGVSDYGYDADDWIITPALQLSSDSIYRVAVSAHADESWAERFSISAGEDSDAAGMVWEVMPPTTITNADYETFAALYRPAATGAIHMGLHVTSPAVDGSYIYVERLTVGAVAAAHAPSAVGNGRAVVTEAGRKVSVSFVAPATDCAGDALQRVDSIVVMRDGKVVGRVADAIPGGEYTVVDMPDANGMVAYTLTPYNAHGQGISAEVEACVGLDVPAGVTKAHVEALDDEGNVSVSWCAPTQGAHGGYIDVGKLTYVVSGIGGSLEQTATMAATQLADQVAMQDGEQRLAWYVITPQNESGTGESVSTDTAFVGKPYALPYEESFPRRQPQHGPWQMANDEVAEWYMMLYGTYTEPADGDAGLLAFATVTEGRRATIIGPKVTLEGSHNPRLRFQTWYMGRGPHALRVMLRASDGSIHELDNFSPIDTALDGNDGEWRTHDYDLSDYRHYAYVQLMLQGVGGHTDEPVTIVPLYVDAISITDPAVDDLAAERFEPTKADRVEVGDEVSFSVMVANRGLRTASGYSVRLWRDGLCVDSVAGTDLAANDSVAVALTDRPNANAKETSRYVATVDWEADTNAANDSSSVAVVTVLPGKPFLTHVTAREGGSGVSVEWTRPDGADDAAEAAVVTEDFESYYPFTISHFGQWSLHDGDLQNTIGIQDGYGDFVQYPNVESPMAFQIFSPGLAGVSSYYFPTHSGSQVAAAFSAGRYTANDDWLVSPEVDGGQTISFWACSPDGSYYGTAEQIQVMASAAGTAVADFVPVGEVITVPSAWTECTAELPAGTRHFALRCVSKDQYILFIDDITYRKAARDFSLVGYNVYRDGALLASLAPTATAYADAEGNKGHAYAVAAVYNVGESVPAPAQWLDADGVAAAETADGVSPVAVYDLSGRRLTDEAARAKGVRIVKQGTLVRKVLVR